MPKKDDYLVNEKIRFPQVLVIAANGDSLGVKSRTDALAIARDAELDLLCVAPQATPPVCRLLNFSKYRYEQEKKQKEIRKNAVRIDTKEIRLSPVIDRHDSETKARHACRFLKDGDKVKVTVRFRGRQLSHPEIGEKILAEFIELCSGVGMVEKAPVLDGKFLIAILAPKK